MRSHRPSTTTQQLRHFEILGSHVRGTNSDSNVARVSRMRVTNSDSNAATRAKLRFDRLAFGTTNSDSNVSIESQIQ